MWVPKLKSHIDVAVITPFSELMTFYDLNYIIVLIMLPYHKGTININRDNDDLSLI